MADPTLAEWRLAELEKDAKALEERVKALEAAAWWKGTFGSALGTGGALALAVLIAKLAGLWK